MATTLADCPSVPCPPPIVGRSPDGPAGYLGVARAYAEKPTDAVIEPITLSTTAADEVVRAALDKKTISVNLNNVTLDEAADTISKLSGVPIVIDRYALEDVGWYAEPRPEPKADEEMNPSGEGVDPFGGAPAAADPFGAPAKPTPPRKPDENPNDSDPFGVSSREQRVRFCAASREPMVSRMVKGATLRDALDLVLRPLDLTWMVRDEAIVITTFEERECYLPTRLYPVRDLVVDDVGFWAPEAYEALIDIVTGIHADTWDQVGGPGSVEGLEGMPSLVVAQTDEIHHDVGRILTRLRHALGTQEANPHPINRAVRKKKDRMVLRVYYVGPWNNKARGTRVDDLVAITRDLVAPLSWSKEARRTIHRFENSIVIRNRPDVHLEFTRLLARLGVRWHSTWEGCLRHTPGSIIPVVGENQKGPYPMGMGGMFNVQDR